MLLNFLIIMYTMGLITKTMLINNVNNLCYTLYEETEEIELVINSLGVDIHITNFLD